MHLFLYNYFCLLNGKGAIWGPNDHVLQSDSLGNDFFLTGNKTRKVIRKQVSWQFCDRVTKTWAPVGAWPAPELIWEHWPGTLAGGASTHVCSLGFTEAGERPVPSPALFLEHSVCDWQPWKWPLLRAILVLSCAHLAHSFQLKTLVWNASCEAARLDGFRAGALNGGDRGHLGASPGNHRDRLSLEFSLDLQRLFTENKTNFKASKRIYVISSDTASASRKVKYHRLFSPKCSVCM